ncbi:ATP-binding protein [Candidatus Omnitrophota bacterium]
MNLTFAFYSLSISWWSLTQIGNIHGPSLQTSLLWARIEQMGVVFIPTFFLHFITVFLGLRRPHLLRFCYSFSTLIAVLSPTTTLVSPSAERKFGVINFGEPGLLYPFIILFFVTCTIYVIYALFSAYRHSTGARRNQLRYLIWPSLLGYLGGSANFLLVYDVNVYPLNPFGTYFVGLYTLAIAYAIIKYRLMEINIALTRAGIFAVVYTLVLGIPFWVGFKTGLWVWAMLLMGALASTGPFIYNYLRQQAERRLRADDLKKHQALTKFAATMWKVRELDRLVRLIVYRLVKTLRVSYAGIYIFDDEDNCYILRSHHAFQKSVYPPPERISQDTDFINFLHNWRKELLYDDIPRLTQEHSQMHNGSNTINFEKVDFLLHAIKASLVIPHFLEDHLIGFLVLGEKEKAKAYSQEDVTALTVLSRSASLAIMNAIFIMKLRETEWELAEAQRVTQIGYLSSAAGHQVNNILNNIAGIAANLLEDDSLRRHLKDDPEAIAVLEKYVNDIYDSVEGGALIIDELKDYAKVEQKKKLCPVSIKEILDKTRRLLSLQVGKFETIEIDVDIPSDLPDVLGSSVQLESVFVNMFNNSYDAIYEKKEYFKSRPEQADGGYMGKITIRASYDKGRINISVSDDGKGIPRDVQKRLFTPLYTTKGSQEKRQEKKITGGTGIGLYTILVIVRNHGGTIRLQGSEFLKGSEFLITLPTAKKEEISHKA